MKMLCCVHRFNFHQESEIKQNCSDIHHVRVLHFNTNLKCFESMNNELNELFCNERSDYLYLLLTVWLAFIRSFYFEKNLQYNEKLRKHLVGWMFSVCCFTLVRNMWLKIFQQIFVGLRAILLVTLLRIKHDMALNGDNLCEEHNPCGISRWT